MCVYVTILIISHPIIKYEIKNTMFRLNLALKLALNRHLALKYKPMNMNLVNN